MAKPAGAAGISSVAAASSTRRSTCALRSARAVAASPVARKSRRIEASPSLEGRFSTIVVPDAYGFGHVVDEDLAIADLAGARGGGERLEDFFGTAGGHHHFQLDLGQQVHVILLPAVHLLMPLLTTVTAHLADGHAVDADAFHRFLHFVQFERLDDSLDFLHVVILTRLPLRLEDIPLFAMHADIQALDLL